MYSLFILGCVIIAVTSVPTDKRGHENHFVGNNRKHDPDFDHQAFLGKDEAQTFDQLSPGEANRRLGIIVDKIDKDKDNRITEQELIVWIKHVATRYVFDDVEKHWAYHDTNKDGHISWEEYKESAYGMVDDMNEIHDHHRNLTFSQVLTRDQNRFNLADKNGDKSLSKEEFADFLHPQEAPHMREVVIAETMMDMDKNKDGFVELDEYVADLWPTYERGDNQEPDWVESEREQFRKHRDKDGDGKLDSKELGDWILPEDFDHAEAEARHLIFEADADKDNVLSKAEILDQQDLFVGSQATDFGDYLVRHDEF